MSNHSFSDRYYGFRYAKEKFDGLPRAQFIAALRAEGIHASSGLGVIEGKPMNKEGCLKDAFETRAFQRIYPKERLANHEQENGCPACDGLVEETVGFHQSALLGSRKDMTDIADAITIRASLERGYDKNGRPVREMVSRWSGSLLGDVRQAFRKSALWQESEGLLIELAAVETQPALSGQGTGQREVDWEDIEITFLSDERVQVRMGEQNPTYNYAEMGFADSRSGKPNQAWRLLRTLAQAKGVIPDSARDGKDFIAFGKRVERLHHRLRAYFKIASDPVPLDSATGYCCRFKVECAPAFKT